MMPNATPLLRSALLRLTLLALAATTAFAQLPRPFYAWWSSPVAKDLHLTPAQRQQIRGTLLGYRGHLIQLRAEIEKAETDLEYQFSLQPVDNQKANEAIERLASARGELTRTLSQMSLRLRATLTQQQWQELQRRRPTKGRLEPPAETDQR
jgi:Spy/CpxP family protein refolding chaperone